MWDRSVQGRKVKCLNGSYFNLRFTKGVGEGGRADLPKGCFWITFEKDVINTKLCIIQLQ